MTAGIEVEMLASWNPRIIPDRQGSEEPTNGACQKRMGKKGRIREKLGQKREEERKRKGCQQIRHTQSSPRRRTRDSLDSISLGSAKVPEPTETENGLDSITGGGVTDPSLVAVMEPNDPQGLDLWRAVGSSGYLTFDIWICMFWRD